MTCPLCVGAIKDGAKRCPHCHGEIGKTWFQRTRSWLGNVVLVALGVFLTVLISSWIVPAVAERLNRDRVLGETRLRIAQSINDQGTLVETYINNLETMLNIFHKDIQDMTPAELRLAQDDLRSLVSRPCPAEAR